MGVRLVRGRLLRDERTDRSGGAAGWNAAAGARRVLGKRRHRHASVRLSSQGAARHVRLQHGVPDRMHRLIAIAGIVLGTIAGTPASMAAQEPAPPAMPMIVTRGEAVLHRPADQAFITVDVENRAKNPRDAQRQNADAMSAVQARVAAAGVPKDAVRTTGYVVQQEFDYANGRRTPREYVARNGIEIRVEPVDRAGELLDVVVQGGATAVSGVRFDLKDRSALEREALRLAVVDARARADALASGAGRSVDRVLRIEDSREPPAVRPMLMRQT